MSSPPETQRCEECQWYSNRMWVGRCTDSRRKQTNGSDCHPIGCPYYKRKESLLRRLWNWINY